MGTIRAKRKRSLNNATPTVVRMKAGCERHFSPIGSILDAPQAWIPLSSCRKRWTADIYIEIYPPTCFRPVPDDALDMQLRAILQQGGVAERINSALTNLRIRQALANGSFQIPSIAILEAETTRSRSSVPSAFLSRRCRLHRVKIKHILMGSQINAETTTLQTNFIFIDGMSWKWVSRHQYRFFNSPRSNILGFSHGSDSSLKCPFLAVLVKIGCIKPSSAASPPGVMSRFWNTTPSSSSEVHLLVPYVST
jgi:hypothetical protein